MIDKEKRSARNNEWTKNNLARITISLKKDELANLEKYCEHFGITKTIAIKARIMDILNNDAGY